MISERYKPVKLNQNRSERLMFSRDRQWREGEVFELMDGSICAWIEQGAIHLKAVELPYGDPVELTESMASQLAATLVEMVAAIDQEGRGR